MLFPPKQELLGSSPHKKKERAWRDGWHAARELGARGVWMAGTRLWGPRLGGKRLWSWRSAEFGWVARSFGRGPRSLDGWHAALEGARGVWVGGTGPAVLDRWHAALELGLAQFGWVARGSGAGGCVEFGWVAGPRARGSGAGASRVWMVARGSGTGGAGGPRSLEGGTRLWSRAPAVLMHVPGTFNIDGLSAGWVTACTRTC